MRNLRLTALALGLLVALGYALPAGAEPNGNDNNAGTIKIHDDMDEDPDQRNVPHVSCDFWVEGFGMNDPEGVLVFFSWPPTGDKTEVTPTGDDLDWESDAEDERGNHHFLVGPFQLEAGHYRVEAYTEDGHPGHDGHFAKAKTFWVEPCEEEFENPPCPEGLVAVANEDGSITLSWDAVAADGYNVYRAVEDGEFEFLDSVGDTTFTDTDTEIDVTYTYTVRSLDGTVESEICDEIEVTAIPFFPGLAATALAGLAAAGLFVAFRRR